MKQKQEKPYARKRLNSGQGMVDRDAAMPVSIGTESTLINFRKKNQLISIVALDYNGHIICLTGRKTDRKQKKYIFPTGKLNHGEKLKDAVERTLMEFTGYQTNSYSNLRSFFLGNDKKLVKAHAILVENIKPAAMSFLAHRRNLEIVSIDNAELKDCVQSGQFPFEVHQFSALLVHQHIS